MRKLTTILAVFCTAACSSGDSSVDDAAPAALAAPADEVLTPDEPDGVGLPIATDDKLKSGLAGGPDVAVGNGWSERDRRDMEQLVAAAVTELTSDAFRESAARARSDYPKIWLTATLGFADSERVAAIVNSADSEMPYVKALVVPRRTGWASTGMAGDGRLRIRLRSSLLDRWRSADPVVKGCAINTMAHEISHTISRDPERYYPAFTDTGNANADARDGVVASYYSGDLALCTALVRFGRIAPADIAQCIPVWYAPGGLQSGRCYAFGGNQPVKWPKDRRSP